MPTEADPSVDLPLLASEFFDYIAHLTDIQEPDCYSTDMDEKELRAKVSHERTQYGVYNPDYVHFEETTEEFVSIGDMDDTRGQFMECLKQSGVDKLPDLRSDHIVQD